MMRHWAIYHNPYKLPYDITEIEPSDAYNSRFFSQLIGSRIWVVGGEGHPCTYYLGSTFICDRVDQEQYGFKFKTQEPEGRIFGRKLILNGLPWFDNLRRSMRNFAVGLIEIKDRFVIEGLVDVVVTEVCRNDRDCSASEKLKGILAKRSLRLIRQCHDAIWTKHFRELSPGFDL